MNQSELETNVLRGPERTGYFPVPLKEPLLRLLLVLVCLPAVCRAADLNAVDVYRPIFTNVDAIASSLPTNFTGAEADAAYGQLDPILSGLAAARSTTNCDWGTRFEEGFEAQLWHTAPGVKTAKTASWAAEYAAMHGDIDRSVALSLDAIRLGRNIGQDRALIDVLIQTSAEKRALESLGRILPRLSPAQRAELNAGLNALPEGGTVDNAFGLERAVFLSVLVRLIHSIQHQDEAAFLFGQPVAADGNTVPGTLSDGEEAPGVVASSSGKVVEKSWLAENLRVSAMVGVGSHFRIGLELKDGDTFFLGLGQRKHDIELVSIDPEKEEAIIVRDREAVLIHLKSREFTPLRLAVPVRALEMTDAELTAAHEASTSKPVRQLIGFLRVIGPDARRALMYETGGTTDGLLAMFERTADDYDQLIQAFHSLPPEKLEPWWQEFSAHLSALSLYLLPNPLPVSRQVQELEAIRQKVVADLAKAP